MDADESEGNSMICKWRSDSFADVDELPAIQTCAERELERHKQMPLSSAVSSASSTSTYDSVLRANRRNEVAYLEALAAHANRCESSGQSNMSTRPGRKPRRSADSARNSRRSTIGVPSAASVFPSEASKVEEQSEDRDRYEAMQMVSREAAIREALELEMRSATGQLQNIPPQLPMPSTALLPSPARARGSAQPLQLSSRRSTTPRSRAALNMQPPQKLITHSSSMSQRASSFGAESFRQAVEASKLQAASSFSKLQAASSFTQTLVSPRSRAVSFGQLDRVVVGAAPLGRSASFGQIDNYRVMVPQLSRQHSPASTRSASFDLGQSVQRSGSVSLVPPVGASPLLPSSSLTLKSGQALVPNSPVPSSAGMQRAASLVEEQAQLAARLSVAAAMIDKMQLDHSVLDEAKRLTELHKTRQAQHQQRRQTPQSPRTAVPLPQGPLPAYQRSAPKSPARSRSGSAGLFWVPPPEAAQLCARCPSLDVAPGSASLPMGGVPRVPSVTSFELSKLSQCGPPPSPLRRLM